MFQFIFCSSSVETGDDGMSTGPVARTPAVSNEQRAGIVFSGVPIPLSPRIRVVVKFKPSYL